jgi:hypothetical protein
MGRCLIGLALLAGACTAKANLPAETTDANDGIDSSASIDAAPDALVLGPWGAGAKIQGASTMTLSEDDGTLSWSTLELVFAVQDAVNGGKDLYYTTRPSPTAAWMTPAPLGFNLVGLTEETPRFAADDLTLYFASNRVGANGLDIYRVTRTAIGSAWTQPAPVDGPNSTANEKWFTPCGGQRYLVIVGGDIAEGTLGSGAPTIVASLSAPAANETGTFLTQDCLTTYFASPRSGTNLIYTSTRMGPNDPWPAPAQVMDFSMIGGNQEDPWLAPDQRTFLFVSDVSGTKDLYFSVR